MEPNGAPIEHEEHHVGNRAGSEAPGYREVDPAPNPARLPLIFERFERHFGKASLHVTAAASLADEDVAFENTHFANLTVDANHVDEAIGCRTLHRVCQTKLRASDTAPANSAAPPTKRSARTALLCLAQAFSFARPVTIPVTTAP